MNKIYKMKKYDFLALSFFLAAIIIYIFGIFKSINWEDEGFYPTVAFRLILGDSLVDDEWHLSQFSSFFLYLPVKFWYTVKGSMDGWIQFSRILFLIIHSTTAIFLYLQLREYRFAGAVASALYFLQAPMLIYALSYNSLCQNFLLYIALVLFSFRKSVSAVKIILLGVLYGFVCICNPVFVVLFPFLAALFFIFKSKLLPARPGRSFLFFLCGLVPVAALAAVFFFATGGTIQGLIDNIPNLFTDVSHDYFSGSSFQVNLETLQKQYLGLSQYFCWTMPLLILVALIDRKKTTHRMIIYLFSSFCVAIYYVIRVEIEASTNNDCFFLWLIPFAFFSLVCNLLSDNRRTNQLSVFFITGTIYAFMECFSSNTGLYAVCFGLGISNISGVFSICNLFKQIYNTDFSHIHFLLKKISSVLLILFLCMQCIYQYSRIGLNFVFLQSNTIISGPYAGCQADYTFHRSFELAMKDIDNIKEEADEDDNILLFCQQPWMYLYLDRPFATYSAWMIPYDADRLIDYYKTNPEKSPDYIYICYLTFPEYELDAYGAESYVRYFQQHFDCTVKRGRLGFILVVE